MGTSNPNEWKRVITLSLGPAWSAPGTTQTINFSPAVPPQTYVPVSNTQIMGNGELFAGLQKSILANVQAQLGLAVAGTTDIQLNGNIWQDNDPDFNNFIYNYKISHSHVAIKGKLLKEFNAFVQPYVGASLGVGFNHAFHYNNLPRLPEVSPEPPFQSDTTTAFTYTLDIGIQKILNQHWSVGMGYEFADWGTTRLGLASGQLTGTGLSVNHVYTNELQFNLSFVA